MKKIIYFISIWLTVVLCFAMCKREDFSHREFYKYVVYLLSQGTYNIYTETFPFNDGAKVTGYFSIGCGGSLTNPQGFDVELEPDAELLQKYNKNNFDIETDKIAKVLSKDRYTIESMKIHFPAKNIDQYIKVAVTVLPDGLSPDSTYFIPLAIKSVSQYEVNPDKKSMLLRIGLENYYASQVTDTYYQTRGFVLNDAGETTGTLAVTKLIKPLSKNKVRLFVGSQSQNSKSTVDDITKNSIVVTIGDDKKVKIEPYGTIQIEQFPGDETWNTYQEVKSTAEGTKMDKYIYLNYRYRTVKTPATETTPAEYNDWVNVKEIMKRLE